MSRFCTCPSCGGLSPDGRAACLHCEAPLRAGRFGRVARALGRAVLGTGALVTLMACYGMVRHHDGMAMCGGDGDDDEVCADRDCDDTRPDVFPGAADPDLDGVDQNCDGVDGWRDPDAPPAAVATDPPPTAPPPPASPPPAIATDPP